MDKRPIGVFDSGLGGLTVVKEIRKFLPREDIVYLGDTARVPYGTRSKEVVTKFSLQDTYFLASQGVKSIVIACNTASSLSYTEIKKRLAIPIVDVVTPGTDEAVSVTRNYRVGVVGTAGTIRSRRYEKLINSLNPKIKVYSQACPLLVPVIETGELKGRLIRILLDKYLKKLKDERIDTLILGCTHYPIICRKISEYLGRNVVLVNPGVGTAKKLVQLLKSKKIESERKTGGKVKYFVTDVAFQFKETAEMFLGEKLDGLVKKIDLE